MSSKPGFKKVANKRDFQKGNLLRIEPDGKPIVLSEVNSKIYAMDAICTHEGAPLEEGNLEEYSLTCPWHYAVFDVRNGKVSDATVCMTCMSMAGIIFATPRCMQLFFFHVFQVC